MDIRMYGLDQNSKDSAMDYARKLAKFVCKENFVDCIQQKEDGYVYFIEHHSGERIQMVPGKCVKLSSVQGEALEEHHYSPPAMLT
jgi:hypothetical protein